MKFLGKTDLLIWTTIGLVGISIGQGNPTQVFAQEKPIQTSHEVSPLTISETISENDMLVYFRTQTGKFAAKKSLFLKPQAEGSIFHQWVSCADKLLQNTEYTPFDDVVLPEKTMEDIVEFLTYGELTLETKAEIEKLQRNSKICQLPALEKYLANCSVYLTLEKSEEEINVAFPECRQLQCYDRDLYRASLLYLAIANDQPEMVEFLYQKYYGKGNLDIMNKFPEGLELGKMTKKFGTQITPLRLATHIAETKGTNKVLSLFKSDPEFAKIINKSELAVAEELAYLKKYGKKISTINGTVFVDVSERDDLKEVKKVLGEKLYKDPQGNIWGDVIKDKSGSVLQLNQRDAFQYCYRLGPKFKLPSSEDYQNLSGYLKNDEGTFTNHLIPGLGQKYYQTSTLSSNGKSNYFLNNGKIEEFKNSDIEAFMCIYVDQYQEA